jgi:hypothetical protein
VDEAIVLVAFVEVDEANVLKVIGMTPVEKGPVEKTPLGATPVGKKPVESVGAEAVEELANIAPADFVYNG